MTRVGGLDHDTEFGMRCLNKGAGMRTLLWVLLVGATSVLAADDKPINANCPIKGDKANPGITTVYKGKVIAFC